MTGVQTCALPISAFCISPQNLGVESDVNRSTAEVAEDRDWDQAIIPLAETIASYITREAIHLKLGFSQIEFKFVGLDRKDESETSNIYKTYYESNLITPNEQRIRLGMPEDDSPWSKMKFADAQIAISAARGAKEIDDPDLERDKSPSSNGATSKSNKNKIKSENDEEDT